MTLDNFLISLDTSEKVLVEAKQLRGYAQQCKDCQRELKDSLEKIKSLLYENDKLKEMLNFYELQNPLIVDLPKSTK